MKNKLNLLFVSLLMVVFIAGCSKKENTGSVDSSSGPKASLANPDFTTDARSLYSELKSNISDDGLDIKPEIKQKYSGKNVRLSGKIKKNIEMLGSREITMEGTDDLGQVFLKFDSKGKAKSENLKAGDDITIQCVGVSWDIGPKLEKCLFVE